MVLRGLKDRGFHGEADAIVFYDLATDYLEVLPVQSRSRSNTLEAFRSLKLVYSDQAPELKNAVTTLGALHRLSTPGMPKTNGLIENKVKLVLHGARVLLRQAGFEPRWWPFAVRHFSMARNIENRGDGSPCMRRHGDGNFSGVILPFGCLVDFYPIAPKIRRDRKGGVQNAHNDFRHTEKIDSEVVDEGGDRWIANEDEKVLTRVHVEARTKLFVPIGANCPVRIKDLGRRRSTVLNYLDGSTEFVVDENWLQAENDRGGNHEWTGETHFDCDFDQIDEDEAEIYENEEYEPECNDEPDFLPTDEVEVEETSVTTALPAEKKERDFIDYGQSADRRERRYAGAGKPNSIDADSWRQMSTRSREIYVQTERELFLREERRREHPERDPAAPAPGRKLLIEFACEPDSRLSAVMMECGGEAIRVHIGSFDITKAKDVSRLIAIIEDRG